ncbi:hypothetical protein LOAG_03888, partial [Loa loa]
MILVSLKRARSIYSGVNEKLLTPINREHNFQNSKNFGVSITWNARSVEIPTQIERKHIAERIIAIDQPHYAIVNAVASHTRTHIHMYIHIYTHTYTYTSHIHIPPIHSQNVGHCHVDRRGDNCGEVRRSGNYGYMSKE